MRFEAPAPRSRILTSVIALLFLVGTIPLGLFGVRLTGFNREGLEAQQKEHQLVIAEAVAREVGEFVRGRRARVEGLARGVEALVATQGDARAALGAVREAGLLHRFIAGDADLLQLVLAVPASGADPRRVEFVSAGRASDPEAQRAEELLVGRVLEQGLGGKETLEAAPGELPLLVVGVPLRDGGRVHGMVGALVRLEELRERIEEHRQKLYAIYVTDDAGSRLLVRSRRVDGPPPDVLGSALVAAFRASGGTRTMPFRAERSGEGRDMLGAFATIPETGWGVFVETDAASAFFAVRRMKETTVRWSIASVLLALVLGALFAQRLVHPIRALAAGAVRLARGDFSRPIELGARNELGLLAGSFNHMADEIRDQMGRLEAAARENKDLFLSSIRMLAEAIDEKDPYTRGHSERVTRFAVATARAYGLPGPEVEKVEIGALLHDVGKIGIDDRILRKPTVLTEEEFQIMKQHPEKGAHIMGAVRQLQEIVPGMRFHHEKVDGTGYPLGLKGDDIPLAAQIISVADTFDAMTTDRPYQKGMDPEYVIGKLHGWVGSRFRGDVVEAFERAWRAGEIQIRQRPVPREEGSPLVRPS